jgi:hypothetical protein
MIDAELFIYVGCFIRVFHLGFFFPLHDLPQLHDLSYTDGYFHTAE